VALVLLFALALLRAAARRPALAEPAGAPSPDRERSAPHPGGIGLPDWRAALGQPSVLRWGLVGGVTAILAHSLVEFGLRIPANLEAHEALAVALGPSPEAEEALRRALALSPWSGEVHDRLGLQLWARGARAEGAAELEESMFRFPSLASHAYLGPAGPLEARDAGQLIQALDEGDVLGVRLAALDDEMAAAIGRGLDRALREPTAGEERAA